LAGLDVGYVSAEREHVPTEQLALCAGRFLRVTRGAPRQEIPLVVGVGRVRKPTPRPDVVYVELLAVVSLRFPAIPAPVAVALANALGTSFPIGREWRKRIAPVLRVSSARMVRGGATTAAERGFVTPVPWARDWRAAGPTWENDPPNWPGPRPVSGVPDVRSPEGAVSTEPGTAQEPRASPQRSASHYAALRRYGFPRNSESIWRNSRADWSS